MSATVMDFKSLGAQMLSNLTPNERVVLAARFSTTGVAAMMLGAVRRSAGPKVKKGRGQRKNRRDRAGRVKHKAHVFAERLLRSMRGPWPR